MSGQRVQVTIEEDGTESPPALPPATVLKTLVGSDGETYHLVRLDHNVKCRRATTGAEWELSELVVAPKFKGHSLERLLSLDGGGTIPVAIANPIASLEEKAERLDFATVVYFAIGWIKKIAESSSPN